MIHPVPGREMPSNGTRTRNSARVDHGGPESSDMNGSPIEPEVLDTEAACIGRVVVTER